MLLVSLILLVLILLYTPACLHQVLLCWVGLPHSRNFTLLHVEDLFSSSSGNCVLKVMFCYSELVLSQSHIVAPVLSCFYPALILLGCVILSRSSWILSHSLIFPVRPRSSPQTLSQILGQADVLKFALRHSPL